MRRNLSFYRKTPTIVLLTCSEGGESPESAFYQKRMRTDAAFRPDATAYDATVADTARP